MKAEAEAAVAARRKKALEVLNDPNLKDGVVLPSKVEAARFALHILAGRYPAPRLPWVAYADDAEEAVEEVVAFVTAAFFASPADIAWWPEHDPFP